LPVTPSRRSVTPMPPRATSRVAHPEPRARHRAEQ